MEWNTQYVPSWLCLKERGNRKAEVIRVHPSATLGSGKARMYEAWLNGKKIYDPASEYRVGQILPLPL